MGVWESMRGGYVEEDVVCVCNLEGVGFRESSQQKLLSCFSLFLYFHAPFPSLLSSPSSSFRHLSLNSLVIMFLDDVS